MKSNIAFFIIFLCFFFMSSCSFSDKKETVNVVNIFPVDSISTFVEFPLFVKYYDNKLFVIEAFGQNRFIKVIDTVNDSLMFSFVDRGNGPNECLSVVSIDIYDDDTYGTVVGIFDVMSRIYQVYSYVELFEMKHLAQPVLKKHFPNSRYCSFNKADEMFIATDLSGNNKRFMLYDYSFDNKKSVCEYRPKPSETFSDETHAILHNGRTFVSPDRNLIGNVIFIAPVLEIFTVEKQNVQPAWEYVIKEMDYTVNGNRSKSKTTLGYLSGVFSDKYIYALFCGKEENEGNYGNDLDVFSYDGEFLKKYRLAQPAFGICIDESKNKLYTLIHEPEPKILIYHIDNI